jgi:hypothetical protein
MFEDIDEHIASGDFYRARAGIRSALAYTEEGNIFAFSNDELGELREKLASVENEIEKREAADLSSVEE